MRDDHDHTPSPTSLPATPAAVARSALTTVERQKRAHEDAVCVVDDLRGAVRRRRLALRLVALLGVVAGTISGGFNPFSALGGGMWAVFLFLPFYMLWGGMLRFHVALRAREVGLRSGPMVKALTAAAKDPQLASDEVVRRGAPAGGWLRGP
jgi:hypothetical protein